MRATIIPEDVPDTRPATELLQGRLEQKLSPGNAHGAVQVRLGRLVDEWVEATGRGFSATELDCDVGDERFVPDLAYCSDRSAMSTTHRGAVTSRITVAFEIASRDDCWRSRVAYKLERYLSVGTVVVVIDPRERTVEIHRASSAPRRLQDAQDEFTLPEMPGLSFTLQRLFGVLDQNGGQAGHEFLP